MRIRAIKQFTYINTKGERQQSNVGDVIDIKNRQEAITLINQGVALTHIEVEKPKKEAKNDNKQAE